MHDCTAYYAKGVCALCTTISCQSLSISTSSSQDGNVAALQDMLGIAQLADLEEPTYGTIPYTPLFLAFMNDHFQVRGRRWGGGEGGGKRGGRGVGGGNGVVWKAILTCNY